MPGTELPKAPRRSPRFLQHWTAIEPQTPITTRKSPRLHPQNATSGPEDPKTHQSMSRNHKVCSSRPRCSSAQGGKGFPENGSGKTGKFDAGARNVPNLSSGSRKSPGLNNGVSESHGLRRSPRFSNQKNFNGECIDYAGKGMEKTRKSDIGLRSGGNPSTGSSNSAGSNSSIEGVGALRRSQRVCSQRNVVDKHVETSDEEDLTDDEKAERGVVSCEYNVGKRERPTKRNSTCPEAFITKGGKSDIGLRSGRYQSTGSSKSAESNSSIEGVGGLRRSQRVCCKRNVVDKHVGTSDEEDLTDDEKAERGVVSCEYNVGKRERPTKRNSISPEAFIMKGEEKKAKEIGIDGKRKRDEEDSGISPGWTNEQELALERAYFTAKPTPHFWKKVSKLVPGKSAQDCFEKIHSANLTPLPPRPRSRCRKAKSSPLQDVALSASRLLKPGVKMLNCNKQKTHLGQKTVRHLLRKHYHVDQEHEADLFSVLEPNMDPSTQAFQSDIILSTPKQPPEKQGFIQKLRERSSSSREKPPSRFRNSPLTTLASPPVLKQVKSRFLHEKYIDQLHCREAKRRAASARVEKSSIVQEGTKDNVQKTEVVKAAKNALVSEARYVISRYKDLQANALSNPDFDDDDDIDSNNEESEDGI